MEKVSARRFVFAVLAATVCLAGCTGGGRAPSAPFVPVAQNAPAPAAATSVSLDVTVPPVPKGTTPVSALLVEADDVAASRRRLAIAEGTQSLPLALTAGTHVLRLLSRSATGERLAEDDLVINVTDCQANSIPVAFYNAPRSLEVDAETNQVAGSQRAGFVSHYGGGDFAVTMRDAAGDAVIGPQPFRVTAASASKHFVASIYAANRLIAGLSNGTPFDVTYDGKIHVAAGAVAAAFRFQATLTTWPTPSASPPPAPCSSLVRAPRAPAPSTGVLIPLYVYPGKVWNTVIRTKLAHSYVPFVVIANVSNGPGTTPDSNYVSFIKKAQMAGIYVLGYVYTKNATRSSTSVDADIASWEAFYHTDGIFLDQMAPHAATYYQAITLYAHGHSQWLVMGNPGVDAPGSAGPDVINFYERAGYPGVSFLRKTAHHSYCAARWSYIAEAVPFNAARIRSTAPYVAYLYAIDGKSPSCYCRLPSYFGKLVALLDTI
jgi:hypothetical protein